MSARKQYSDAEKAEYYRKKAQRAKYPRAPRKPKVLPSRIPREPVSRAVVVAEKPPGMISKAGMGVGTALGSAFGPVGSGIGGFLGGKLGHLIEKVTGFGDYQVDKNSILKGGLSPPEIVNTTEKGGVIVRHREYIGDVTATTGFTVQSYIIQPGLAQTFPWLSQMANAYEQYRLRGMIFEFKSTSSDALLSTATSTALGSVSMSTDYDVADPVPLTKREMLNSEFSCSSKPSETIIHPIECKKSQSPQNLLYTRGALAVPSGFDQRLYDFARFNIATEGMQAAGGILGELWVTYEIELYKQQFYYLGLSDHIRALTVTNSVPLGVVSGTPSQNGTTIGGTISANGQQYVFPSQVSSGKYFFSYTVLGGGIANCAAPAVTFTNASGLAYLTADTLSAVNVPQPSVAANQTTCMVIGTFQITGQNATINFGTAGVLPGPTNYMDLFVVRMPDSWVA